MSATTTTNNTLRRRSQLSSCRPSYRRGPIAAHRESLMEGLQTVTIGELIVLNAEYTAPAPCQ